MGARQREPSVVPVADTSAADSPITVNKYNIINIL